MRYLFFLLIPFLTFGQTVVQEQIMFTPVQIDTLVARVNINFAAQGTAWASGSNSGESDIRWMINRAQNFLADPYLGRLDWMPTTSAQIHGNFTYNPTPSTDGIGVVNQNIYYAAHYAFILWNRNGPGAGADTGNTTDQAYAIQLANAIATQIYIRTTEPGLQFGDKAIWDWENITSNTPYSQISIWIMHMANCWSLIAPIQNNLSLAQEAAIDTWFTDEVYSFLIQRTNRFYDAAFGSNWDTTGPVSTGYNTTTGGGVGITHAVGGVPQTDYTMNFASHTVWANLPGCIFLSLNTVSILYNISAGQSFAEQWYKYYFQNHVFSDGTSYENKRAVPDHPEYAIHYQAVTQTQLAMIAHQFATAILNNNPVVSGRSYNELFEYKTSLGLEDFFPAKVGSNTGGGPKGLELYTEGLARWVSQYTNLDLWGEVRQSSTSPYPEATVVEPNNGEIGQYFPGMGIANAYYNNQTIKNCYSGTGGFVGPKMDGEDGGGYQSAWAQSYMGPFGTTQVAFPYIQNEGVIYGISQSNPDNNIRSNKKIFLKLFYNN